LQKSKEKAAMAQFASTNSSEETWRVLLAFEGETHYFEKASELYSNLPRFRELIDSCIKILKENYGILIDAYELFNKVSVKDGQPEKSQSNVSRLIFRYSLSALLSDLGADIYWITGNEGNSLTSVVALKKKKFTDMLDEFMKPDKRNGISYGLTENESGPNKASEESFEYIKITENTGLKEFLDIVGRLWLSGTEINWKTIYADERRLKVPLPKYPFQHQKFWMNPLTEAKPLERKYENDMEKVQAEIKKSRNEIDQWFYTQVWKRFTGAFEYKNDRQKRDIILFDYNGENSFTNFLRHKENNVIKVVPGEQFKFSREHGYTINPLNKEDYQRLFDELSEMGITPGVIIHSWCVRSKVDHDAIARADRSVDMGVNSIAMLLKIINSNKSYKNIEITVVTENANDVTGTETLAPENALIMGAFNVAQLEYPNIMMKYIDVDLPLSEDRIYTMENIYGIIFGTDFGIRCALRGRHIWQRSFEQLPTYAFDRKNSKLKDGGVYLITGGFGGIGFTFAKYLAANYKAKLVLLGRKGIQHDIAFAAPSDVKKTKDAENKVSELERYGAEVLAVSGDVSDKAAMEKLKAGIIERFGRIDGIIHAAGIPGEGLIELKKPEETRAVLKPKVFGTLVLNQVFGDDLDFMVLCSSINSICARAGQYDYAAANAFLDAFAQHKANSGVTNVISLNWDTWNETGMAAEYAGIAGIDKNHFEYHPLLGECLYSVENQIIYKTILSLNNWELSEHAIAGKPTLPGTAFIEMIYGMAKRHLGKGIVELNNINFMTPVAIESGEMEILTILKQEAGTWNFTVLSQNEDGKAHYHAVGKIKLSDKTEQQTKKLNWDKDNFNVDAEPLGKTKFGMYNIERRKIMRGELAVDSLVISQQDSEGVLRTMEFGPRWNTLRSVKYSDNEAVGLFEPEADLTEDYKMYANHPALLDFATSFFRLYKSPEVFLPFSYKKITFFKPLKGPFSSWVRQVYKDKDKVNDNTMSFNISLFDAHGSHLLEIEEFSVIRVDNYKKLEHGAVKSKTLEKTYGLKERLIIEDIEPGIRNHEGIQVLETALKAATQHIVISTRDLSMRMNRINELAKLYSDSSYQNKSSVIKGRRPEMNVPYVAPQNETEKLIASIWSDAMGIEQIGINDNYFDLGGDSLLITEIHSKFLDKTGVEISVANMLQYNTVAAISAFIDEKGNNNEEKLKKIENIDTITDKRRESLKKIREKALIKNEFINYREE
jgi:polyketide synthase PksJ